MRTSEVPKCFPGTIESMLGNDTVRHSDQSVYKAGTAFAVPVSDRRKTKVLRR